MIVGASLSSARGPMTNDSPGYGKKISKSKAANEVPASTGHHLSLEAKAIIFEIFEKFKRGELKVLSNKKKWGKKKSVEQTAYTCGISKSTVNRVKVEGNGGNFLNHTPQKLIK